MNFASFEDFVNEGFGLCYLVRVGGLLVSSSIPRNSRVDAGPAVLSWARGRLIFAARF